MDKKLLTASTPLPVRNHNKIDYQYKLLYALGVIFVICDHSYRGGNYIT